jgi:hypothetical protein
MVEHFDPRIKFCKEVNYVGFYPVGKILEDGGTVISGEVGSCGKPDWVDVCYSKDEGQCGICGWRINCGYFKSKEL